MYVIHSKKLIYFAMPRTGSVSVRSWLEENEEVERIHSYPMWPPGWGDHHAIDLVELQEFKKRGYKCFSCVRNHWDWMVSIYHWDKAGLGHPPFDVYLDQFFFGPHHANLFMLQDDVVFYGQRYGLRPKKGYLFWLYPQFSDYVIRFEQQEQALRNILRRQDLTLEVKNASDRLPYHRYYDDRLVEKVRGWFGTEIDELGYYFQGGNNGESREAESEV